MTVKLDPNWIVGFVDGEGCFNVSVIANKQMPAGFQIQPEFTVVQGEIDAQLLHGLKDFFECGSVTVNRRDHTSTHLQYRVKNLTHFKTIIIPFFEKHQLRSKKRIEFERFRTICLRLINKEHLTEQGFIEITALAAKLHVFRCKP